MTLNRLRRHPSLSSHRPRWQPERQREAAHGLAQRLRAAPLRARRPPLESAKHTAIADAPALDRLVLSRASFGPTPTTVEELDGLGATPAERRQNWVEWQLEPDAIPDSELQSRLEASRYATLDLSLEQLWTGHQLVEEFEDRMLPILETQYAAILRAAISRRQLAEVLADFWHNHFNVYGWHDTAGPVFVHYDRDVIRANALGNFRTFLEAMSSSAAMQLYLDNAFSSADGPNENFARELLELHTLGESAYYGAIPASQVPTTAGGLPRGYVDEDVRELARCLTGWSLDEETGAFRARPLWHDTGPKTVLGLAIPAGQSVVDEVRTVLDRLAAHPATARHVCTKLCQRFVADDPPTSLVEAATATFLTTSGEPDQLRRVVRQILLSDEIASSWGGKVRRPFELIVAALRGLEADLVLPVRTEDRYWLVYLLYATGNMPHDWGPPTGYPDTRGAWLTTNALMSSWRLMNLLTWYGEGDFHPVDVLAVTPADHTTPNALADYWLGRLSAAPVATSDRAEIVDFLAQGRSPDLALDRSDPAVAQRIQSAVGLVLLSPAFVWR